MRKTHWPTIIGSFGTKVDAIVDKGDGLGTEMHMTIKRDDSQVQQPDIEAYKVTGLQHYVHGVFCGPLKADDIQLAFQELNPEYQVTVDMYRQASADDMPYHRVFIRYPKVVLRGNVLVVADNEGWLY